MNRNRSVRRRHPLLNLDPSLAELEWSPSRPAGNVFTPAQLEAIFGGGGDCDCAGECEACSEAEANGARLHRIPSFPTRDRRACSRIFQRRSGAAVDERGPWADLGELAGVRPEQLPAEAGLSRDLVLVADGPEAGPMAARVLTRWMQTHPQRVRTTTVVLNGGAWAGSTTELLAAVGSHPGYEASLSAVPPAYPPTPIPPPTGFLGTPAVAIDSLYFGDPFYPPTPIPPASPQFHQDCEILLPWGPPELNPEVGGSVGGLAAAPSLIQFGSSPALTTTPMSTSTGTAASGTLLAPPKAYCPKGYDYDFLWQSCWPAGVPHDPPEPGQHYPHACNCPAGESYLVDTGDCWPQGYLSPGGTGFLGPGDKVSDEQACAVGYEWNFEQHRCEFTGCPAGTHHSYSDQQCVVLPCAHLNNEDITVVWTHSWGDCVDKFDNWEKWVTRALKWAYKRVKPAVQMLGLMDTMDDEWRQIFWNYGGSSWNPDTYTEPGDALSSLRSWFGEYDPFHFELIIHTILNVWSRLDGTDPPNIWCNTTAGCCGGAEACALVGGTMKLCEGGWWQADDEGIGGKGWIMLHELLHYAMAPIADSFPADVRWEDCTPVPADAEATWPRCYGPTNAGRLAEHPEVKIVGGGHPAVADVPAAILNVDNYTSWIWTRFLQYEGCSVPEGISLP